MNLNEQRQTMIDHGVDPGRIPAKMATRITGWLHQEPDHLATRSAIKDPDIAKMISQEPGARSQEPRS